MKLYIAITLVLLTAFFTYTLLIAADMSTGTGDISIGGSVKLTPGSAPATAEGVIYGNSTDHNIYYYDGTSWVDLTAAAGAGAPTAAKYIVQQAHDDLSAEQALGALATGILKSTTTTGVVSIAVAGTDYYAPGGTDVAQADGGTAIDSSGVTNGQLLIGNTTGNVFALSAITGTANEITVTNGASSITIDIPDPLIVGKGGMGAGTFTDGGILLGSGTAAVTAMAVLANGSIVVGDGTTDPVALAAFTSSTGQLKHESGGLEADVNAYTGLLAISGGATSEVDAKSELEAQIADVADFADAAGEIAIDTNATAYGSVEIYGATGSALLPAVKKASATIYDPDTIQSTEDAIPLLRVETEWAPHGITIVDIFLAADASNSGTYVLEEWTDPTTWASDIESCAFSASTEFEDDGTLADAAVAAGSYVFIDFDTTALNFLQVTFTYIINEGN